MESEPINQLRYYKEESYIDPQKSPEIPWRSIDRISIECENEAAGNEKQGCARVGGAAESHAHQGVTTRFQKGCCHQNHHRKTVTQR